MKSTVYTAVLALALLTSFGAAAQATKVLKSEPAVEAEWVADRETGMGALLLHFTGDPVSSMSFAVELPEGVGNAALKNCVADLPKSHTGACSVVGRELRVVVYSMTNEILQPQTLGFVTFKGVSGLQDGGKLPISKVDAARAVIQ